MSKKSCPFICKKALYKIDRLIGHNHLGFCQVPSSKEEVFCPWSFTFLICRNVIQTGFSDNWPEQGPPFLGLFRGVHTFYKGVGGRRDKTLKGIISPLSLSSLRSHILFLSLSSLSSISFDLFFFDLSLSLPLSFSFSLYVWH